MCSHRFPYAPALIVLFLTAGTVLAGEPKLAQPPLVDEPIRQAMQDRDYPAAVKAIDSRLKVPETPHDYLTYLKGRALTLQKQYAAALEVFEGLRKQFPDSEWARRGRFASAQAMALSGDFRQAEGSYRSEAESLFSAQRKQQIADICLEYADALFEPPDDEQPNYARARQFYVKAMEMGLEPGRRAEVELRSARCLQETYQYDEAGDLFEKFAEEHADSPLAVEALFRLGECRLERDKPILARRAWRDLLLSHADAESEWVAEAMFHIAFTWNILQPKNEDELTLGVAALDRFLDRYADHKLAGQAQLDIAQSYVHLSRHAAAVARLVKFLADERYADAKEIPQARNLLGRTYSQQKKYPEAIAVWRKYLTEHPTETDWSDVQRSVIEAEAQMAEQAFKARRFDEARRLFAEFMAKYPLDERQPQMLYRLGEMLAEEKKWDEAIAAWRRLISKHPVSNEASRAGVAIGRTLEEELGSFEEALKQYGKITRGSSYSEASQGVSRLSRRTLTVATERVFRSDEVPRVRLTTRNVEKVDVRAYRIDLEAYFRKMHRTEGIQDLDISLIGPDRSFEYEVPAYAKFREFVDRVEVPTAGDAGSGVMAVTASSDRRESTTLLVQSDLDIVVKSSRDAVFVFAQNMRTGKPWPGVQLLLSNGDRVFAEGTTGDDGVWQATYKGLAASSDVRRAEDSYGPDQLRVFARVDGHVASSRVTDSDLTLAKDLTNKGYIYTDSPVYSPGQAVHVRGCVRRAVDGAYVVGEVNDFSLDVFDHRNRPIWQDEVKLGPFGTFHTDFPLPDTTGEGDYRIRIQNLVRETYAGTFVVQHPQTEPVRIVIDVPRTAYYRGEIIEGTIRAEHDYGTPLSQHEVQYQLEGGRPHTAKTDANGEAPFRVRTDDYEEPQVLKFSVTLPERNVKMSTSFTLATRGFAVAVSTPRQVFLAGEPFEVSILTRDAEDAPVSRQLKLKVFEKTEIVGEPNERLVDEHPLETDADHGEARLTLKLDQGGEYRLQAEGTDRFGNSVTGDCPLRISGDDDKVRLLILCDKSDYRVGETADVVVHWREEPALALLSFESEHVLDYQLLNLKKGTNPLKIPMTDALAPNFQLNVNVMVDPRKLAGNADLPEGEAGDAEPDHAEPGDRQSHFHTASQPFSVKQDLEVKLAVRRKDGANEPIRPGDEVEIGVTTSDSAGKPVPAELSLALVEQSGPDRVGDPSPQFGEIFRTPRRECTMEANSSITFEYGSSRASTDGANGDQYGGVSGADATTETGFYEEEPVDLWGGSSPDPEPLSDDLFESPEDSSPIPPGGNPFGSDDDPFASNNNAEVALFADTSQQIADDDPFGGGGVHGDVPVGTAGNAAKSQTGNKAVASSTSRPVPVAAPDEIGYWNPAVMTGDDGKASLTITLPGRSTAWRLVAEGITVDTLVGSVTEPLAARSEFYGSLQVPPALTDGDEVEIIASIHNDLVDKGRVDVVLKTTIAGKTFEEKREIQVSAKGVEQVRFPTKIAVPKEPLDEKQQGSSSEFGVTFELTVSAGGRTDIVRRTVPLRPYGMPVQTAVGGVAAADTTVWVQSPEKTSLKSQSLQIAVGPTVEQSLIDVVLARSADGCGCVRQNADFHADHPHSGECSHGFDACPGTYDLDGPLATVTSDLMAAVSLLGPLRVEGETGDALKNRVRTAISQLTTMQGDDGSFSLTGHGGPISPLSTARVVWALSLARKAGYHVPGTTYRRAVELLKTHMVKTSNTDYEMKAILLHALATAGHDDFAVANRLHRSAASLSTPALAYLALAFAEMDRKDTAAELVETLKQRDMENVPAGEAAGDETPPKCLRWSQSPVELRALAALAIQSVAPNDDEAKKLVEWLVAHRTGRRFSPDKATGPAAAAVCQWYGRNRFDTQACRITVSVNNQQVKVLELDPQAETQIVDVPAGLLAEGKQRIDFQLNGQARYTYQCVLGGFVPVDQVVDTTDAWSVERTYQPAWREVDGREIPRGFQPVNGPHKTFRNPLTQLAVGQRGLVDIRLLRSRLHQNIPTGQLEYLVVTEPIPSGTTVLEASISGPFEHYEIGANTITFYLGNHRFLGTIHYELLGRLPGSYRAAPTIVRNMVHPDQMAVGRPTALTVIPKNTESTDPYRLTPLELFELGKLYADKDEFEKAAGYLSELVDNWALHRGTYKQSVEMLLDAHLKIGPAAAIVRYFEIIKENWPNAEIPFDQVLAIGAAYEEMGEFERSYLVFRAAVEARFQQESAVAGFLQHQSESLHSMEVMRRLLREYPPEPYVARATQGLAQTVYAKAAKAEEDGKLRQAEITRDDMIRAAWRMFESQLTDFPDDSAADRAAFSAATALLDLEDYAAATAACSLYAERYPQSDLLDTFWYIIGYCQFARGEHEAALDMCRKVAEHVRTDPKTGRSQEARNKWQAIYILGQIYHSLGRPAEAIEQYRRVAKRFTDARRSIAQFTRRAIRLPEVSTFQPGDPVRFELTYRNVPACEVKVFRIDLMKFGQLRRTTRGMADVNLAGVYPLHEVTVELGDGQDYRDRTRQLDLPLKEEGAYLVVARGGNLHTSGLALVTPLTLEVEEDAVAGHVRVEVKDRTQDRCLPGANIKVIGSAGTDVVSGETDLRGIFAADDVCGAVTVIAQAPGDDQTARYAFYRGRTILQPAQFLTRSAGSYVAERVVQGESAGVDLAGGSDAEQQILATLEAPTRIHAIEKPLQEVVDELQKLHRIRIQVDTRALEDVGIGTDTPITRTLQGITLKSALRLMLRELDLTYVIKNEVLVITTPEEAECQLITRAYPVGDLIRYRDEKEGQWVDFDTMIELITSTIAPVTWCDAGGSGSIDGTSLNDADLLVISQTREVLEEVEDLLAKFRQLAPRKEGDPPPLMRQPVGANPYMMGGGMSGMGGFGGGMGMGGGMGAGMGMGGGFGGMGGEMQPQTFMTPVVPGAGGIQQREGTGGPANLLQGLQNTQRGLQDQQVDQMQEMYQGGAGMGGMSAGGMF